MTLFFFVVALELKHSLFLGKLRALRGAALSLAGALGGMLVPATLYVALMNSHLRMYSRRTVVATDTAFVIECLAPLGSRIPPSLRLFLLSLAVFDDVDAILVVAVGYVDTLNWAALDLAALDIVSMLGATLIWIRSPVVYFLLAGVIWLCLDASGIPSSRQLLWAWFRQADRRDCLKLARRAPRPRNQTIRSELGPAGGRRAPHRGRLHDVVVHSRIGFPASDVSH